MRCSNIHFHADIPVPTNSDGSDQYHKEPSFKDLNGVTYEIQAIKSACNTAKNAPVIRYDEHGNAVPIGIINSAKWNDGGYIEVEGVIMFGGTNEEVVFSSANDVVSMDIESFGFGN